MVLRLDAQKTRKNMRKCDQLGHKPLEFTVILGLDSDLYMHLHPLGSISMSAQQKFMKTDTDDFICDFGLIEDEFGNFQELDGMGRIVFPSINLKRGNYRFFVQVKIKESQEIVSKQFDFSIN